MSLPATTSSSPMPPGPTLRDIHLPPAPSWWPLAPGWWVLAILIVLMLAFGIWRWSRRSRAVRSQGEWLLGELDQLTKRFHEHADSAALAADLHQLLRRVALGHASDAGRLRGDAWKHILARVPVSAAVMDRLVALEPAMYDPSATLDADATLDAARQWLSLAAKPTNWRPLVPEHGNA